jgi:hypothetical protein
MPRYYVTMTVDFAGHIEADSEDEAEQKAWTSWGDTMDNDLTYDGVNDIEVALDDADYCEEHETYECAFCEEEEDDD